MLGESPLGDGLAANVQNPFFMENRFGVSWTPSPFEMIPGPVPCRISDILTATLERAEASLGGVVSTLKSMSSETSMPRLESSLKNGMPRFL